MAVNSEPLIALLEVMLRTLSVPRVKPGGHPEEIFLNLTEEEQEKFECSICYQIMKEVRECKNKHRFCYSCIFVWSTSGNPVNHDRCPVCRTEGDYIRNHDLDEQINLLRVKCSMKSCTWTGILKYLPSHQHTTYNKFRPVQSPRQSTAEPENVPDLPPVTNTVRSRPSSRSETVTSTTPRAARLNTSSQTNTRMPLSTINSNVQTEPRQSTSTNTSSRTRTRTRHRHASSNSPQRRSNVTATGLSRLTSRARIQNDGSNGSNETSDAASNTQFAPRPPPGPRPNHPGRSPRRMPTLPSIINNSSNSNSSTNANSEQNGTQQTDINNNSDANVTTNERPPRHTVETARSQRQAGRPGGFSMIRDRLNESRQRLDLLMGAFSVELDRGRRDLTEFQQERERRRTEQLQEVRDLGRRLGHVAQELRGLLNQRSQIRQQINQLADSNEDDFD